MVKRTISLVGIVEGIILLTSLYSFATFINIQIAFLSSFFVIMGSSYAYKRMVKTNVETKNIDAERDLLDTIEDPHELYDEKEINNAPAEELNLKEIVKEEKSKIKTFSFNSMKHGARGSVSAFRLTPYLLLVLGFIALKNNEYLDLTLYLPSLLIGIIIGSISSTKLVK